MASEEQTMISDIDAGLLSDLSLNDDDLAVIFSSPTEFSMFVETLAKNRKQSILEVLVAIQKFRDLEPETIKSYLSESLLQKLRMQCEESGDLPRTKRTNLLSLFS